MAQVVNFRPHKQYHGVNPEDRRRSWLDSYEGHKWTVTDTIGTGDDSQIINFDVPMADGRSLIRHEDLYATAKELVFWIRAGTYTRIDDAERHKQYGANMVRLCYGLTARGIYSFGSLTTIEIDAICADAAFGADGLTVCSQRIKKLLSEYTNWGEVPEYLAKDKEFDAVAVRDQLNIPRRWLKAEVESEVRSATARLNGKLLLSVADLKEEPITSQNINLVTMVIEALFALRHVIEATSIAFRPFPEGAARRAEDLGRLISRTPVPPPELAMRLLENTTRYMIDHNEHVLALYRDLMAERGSSSWSRGRAEEVAKRVRSLVVACYILIAAFTARRTEEIKLLERECLAGNNGDGWWMRIYIEKTERQLTWMPVPDLVARAVEILKSLTTNPDVDPKSHLFEYADPVSGKIVELSPETQLNNFTQSIGAREYANDNNETKEWSWITRQFRRLFAVIFFYRYRGRIQTLAHQLRHFDSRMTNDYVTMDPEVAKIWDQEVWNHQIEIARDIVTGRTTYSGAMGKRLTRLVEVLRVKFSDSITVVSEAAGAALVRQLRKGQHVLTPKLWVTCSCPRTHGACEKAACRKLSGYGEKDVGPEFASAGPGVCPDCPFALIGPENLVYIDEQRAALAASAKAMAMEGPTIFAELQAAQLLKITTTSNRQNAA
ncbi:hypothetical protein HFO27_23460 [Rhizobium leguminosarum]|uniref:hypothetical protein n=1 Tax=Rhizobium leguminosarum TaxID=384 RepID=UPI001C8FEAEB|nr:hypothetical protein [Rhizobium leguminosarum]MBY3177562.1 hypothetical protein [Rhizobium leguminosarum]